MYNTVNGLPVTGGAPMAVAGSAGMMFAFDNPIVALFSLVALFTMYGGFEAMMRTGPALGFLHREPEQLAPTERPKLKPHHLRSRWYRRQNK